MMIRNLISKILHVENKTDYKPSLSFIKYSVKELLLEKGLDYDVSSVIEEDDVFCVNIETLREGNLIYYSFYLHSDDNKLSLENKLLETEIATQKSIVSLHELDYLFESEDIMPEAAWLLLGVGEDYNWYLNRYNYLNKGETE